MQLCRHVCAGMSVHAAPPCASTAFVRCTQSPTLLRCAFKSAWSKGTTREAVCAVKNNPRWSLTQGLAGCGHPHTPALACAAAPCHIHCSTMPRALQHHATRTAAPCHAHLRMLPWATPTQWLQTRVCLLHCPAYAFPHTRGARMPLALPCICVPAHQRRARASCIALHMRSRTPEARACLLHCPAYAFPHTRGARVPLAYATLGLALPRRWWPQKCRPVLRTRA